MDELDAPSELIEMQGLVPEWTNSCWDIAASSRSVGGAGFTQ